MLDGGENRSGSFGASEYHGQSSGNDSRKCESYHSCRNCGKNILTESFNDHAQKCVKEKVNNKPLLPNHGVIKPWMPPSKKSILDRIREMREPGHDKECW